MEPATSLAKSDGCLEEISFDTLINDVKEPQRAEDPLKKGPAPRSHTPNLVLNLHYPRSDTTGCTPKSGHSRVQIVSSPMRRCRASFLYSQSLSTGFMVCTLCS